MVVIYLCKYNMDTILLEFCNPSKFHGSDMFFLKGAIRYAFQEPIQLVRSSFGLKLENIPKRDRDIINTMFFRMDKNLFLKDSCYINYSENKEELLNKGDAQKIHVEIQGYKRSPNGVYSPIWKILSDKFY